MKMKLINQKRLKMKMKIKNQFQNENENQNLKSKFLFLSHFVIILYHFKVNFVNKFLFSKRKKKNAAARQNIWQPQIKIRNQYNNSLPRRCYFFVFINDLEGGNQVIFLFSFLFGNEKVHESPQYYILVAILKLKLIP